MTNDLPERWADVPGYGGKYQASTWGNIRRVSKNGSYRAVKQFARKTSENRYVYNVTLTSPDGRRHDPRVLSVISATWMPAPPGYVAIHKNGMLSDNRVENIRIVKREELPRIYANRGRQRPVCKLDENGDVIECYANPTQAARENYIDLSTMLKHLNGRVKNPIITDGIRFRWEEQDEKGEKHGRRKKV